MSRETAVGRHLAVLREQAGLKQNELAKRLEWSPAVLSRIETGERALSDDELEIILRGIGTPEAAKLGDVLSREWKRLPEPALGDPDSDLLWEAELAAQRVHDLAEQPDVKQFFERRLVRYEAEISAAAQRVTNKRYRVALLGTIAAGKSTAICRAEGLEIPNDKGMPKPVLETGAGGITFCEVHLHQGPGYGLIVEPCSEDEVRRYVIEFANFLLSSPQIAGLSNDNEDEAGTPGIAREVERALRNMTGLRRRRAEKKRDGSVVPAVDLARDLAANFSDVKSLSVEILARMELHKRDRRDAWHSDASEKTPLEWLQSTFEKVNNGLHPDFTLPKRIELVVPMPILGEESVCITLIDTQGIDDFAGRADLEQHFDDSHTVVLLCTVFNEAPSTAVRQLLARAKEGGIRTLGTHVGVLALPRPGEALAMKDNGYPVQSASEGYDIKAEEVQLKLHPLGLANLPVVFFNASEDAPDTLRSFIRDRVNAISDFHRQALREIVNGANALLENYETEQSREATRTAARSLTIWLSNSSQLSTSAQQRVHESLLVAVGSAHPRTIHASVVRDGSWYNLDYAHQLSHGARRIATSIVQPKLDEFRGIATNLLNDDQLIDAHDLVRQSVRTLEGRFDNLIRMAQLVGQSIHADELRADSDFWRECAGEWGRGSGYRDRINAHTREWFDNAEHAEVGERVIELVRSHWDAAIAELRELLAEAQSSSILDPATPADAL